MITALIIIWLAGAFLTFCGDAYFEGKSHDEPGVLFGVCIFWFIFVPIFLLEKLYLILSSAGEARRQKLKEAERIRIADEQEKVEILQEAEKEADIFVKELHSKRRGSSMR